MDATPLTLEQELDVRVAGAEARLSGNDERVLAFLREHLDELAFHTAESLAQGAGVSAAGVVRFARRLGFASFRELRERAREQLQGRAPRAPADRQPADSTLARKVARDVASLELLPRLLEEPLARAAELVAQARATWFLANRETYGLAVYGARLMHHVRPRVRLVDPSFPDLLRDVGEGDALIACSFRPYARQTLELMVDAHEAHADVVLITDGRVRSLADAADVVLRVPVESPTMLLSFTPAICVLEVLIAQMSMLDADRTHDSLERTARFLDRHDIVVERAGVGRRSRRDRG